jgi:hypothetical protein
LVLLLLLLQFLLLLLLRVVLEVLRLLLLLLLLLLLTLLPLRAFCCNPTIPLPPSTRSTTLHAFFPSGHCTLFPCGYIKKACIPPTTRPRSSVCPPPNPAHIAAAAAAATAVCATLFEA